MTGRLGSAKHLRDRRLHDGLSRSHLLAFQHVLYVLMEPFAFLEHDAEEPMALFIRQVRVVSKNFREAPDHCQRRLQVVGDSRQLSSYDVNGTLSMVPTSCAGGAGQPASGRLRRNALADERQELRRRQWLCGGLTLRLAGPLAISRRPLFPVLLRGATERFLLAGDREWRDL